MNVAAAPNPPPLTEEGPIPEPPLRKESYTTFLYLGFALVVAVLTVVGFLWW